MEISAIAKLASNSNSDAIEKIGKYQIIKELGKGATSAVYLAVDPFANRKVAVKVVQREVLGDKEHGKRFRKLFLTEASLAGKLSHPHIAAIFDAVADEEGSYIVMEYVEGGTLEQHTKLDNLLPINKIIEIIFKCCKALDYAHRHGVIHRDIKPANILLSKDTDIKISDFGAALTTAAETTQVTGIGSPAYMSPEQVQEQQLTHQTDIFSLGVVMYQLLTGSLPFKATNNYSMVFQIINVDPPPPSIFRPEIPASVDQIVKKALQKRLETRYQTWEEFAQDLVRVFNNLQTPGAAGPRHREVQHPAASGVLPQLHRRRYLAGAAHLQLEPHPGRHYADPRGRDRHLVLHPRCGRGEGHQERAAAERAQGRRVLRRNGLSGPAPVQAQCQRGVDYARSRSSRSRPTR